MKDVELLELILDQFQHVRAELAIIKKLIKKGEVAMTAELKALQDQVAENTAVEQSAVTLIQGLAAQMEAAKEDPAAIEALSTQLKNSADALAAAIMANTPAA